MRLMFISTQRQFLAYNANVMYISKDLFGLEEKLIYNPLMISLANLTHLLTLWLPTETIRPTSAT